MIFFLLLVPAASDFSPGDMHIDAGDLGLELRYAGSLGDEIDFLVHFGLVHWVLADLGLQGSLNDLGEDADGIGEVGVFGALGLEHWRVNVGDNGLGLGSLGDRGQQFFPTLISFSDV